MINAAELHKIAEYLHVSMDSLVKLPEKTACPNITDVFIERVKTQEAKEGIQFIDKLSDMILFHTRVYENGKKMEQLWKDNQ